MRNFFCSSALEVGLQCRTNVIGLHTFSFVGMSLPFGAFPSFIPGLSVTAFFSELTMVKGVALIYLFLYFTILFFLFTALFLMVFKCLYLAIFNNINFLFISDTLLYVLSASFAINNALLCYDKLHN